MRLYIETSHTARTHDRSGIPTVVRNLVSALAQRHEVMPLRWSVGKHCLTPLKIKWEENLEQRSGQKFHLPLGSALQPRHWGLWAKTFGMNYKAPIHLHPAFGDQLKGEWLILAELMMAEQAAPACDYARKHGMKLAGIFYDAIPWLHPELVFTRTRQHHIDYMKIFAACDVVIPISRHAGEDFMNFAQQHNLKPTVRPCNLPGEIVGRPRATEMKKPTPGTVKMLFVSTLEPRKNHLVLLEAFEQARSWLPDIKLELHLVGAFYKGSPEIADAARAAVGRNIGVFWHQGVGSERLRQFYDECDFTIYTSSIEGFGLPVMESLWFGRPCICSNSGVIGENAEGGGCVTVDVRNAKSLADAMVKLAGDGEFRKDLSMQALQRKVTTWSEYADDVVKILKAI